MSFNFLGTVEGSKSMLNRALIIQSFFSQLEILGESQCNDVQDMRRALKHFDQGIQDIYCGSGGTVFRFMTLKASRRSGKYILRGSSQLMKRPHEELLQVLGQLGVETSMVHDGISLESQGWLPSGDAIHINSSRSSQFASAVVLSAWGLKRSLCLCVESLVSTPYFLMTLKMCESLGMNVELEREESGVTVFIHPAQALTTNKIFIEPDLSNVFFITALALVSGKAVIKDFPFNSLQPDILFLKILDEMNFSVEKNIPAKTLKVSMPQNYDSLLPVAIDLNSAPDLFPIIALLCVFVNGRSVLRGLSHLNFKESQRLRLMCKLFEKMQVPFLIKNNSTLVIEGDCSFLKNKIKKDLEWDVGEDHRLVMVAEVLKAMGYKVAYQNKESIKKSFSNFLFKD